MPIDQAPVNFTPLTELLAPPPEVQPRERERPHGNFRLFVKTGGQADEIGGTLRVELSRRDTSEITVKQTMPLLGPDFTTVELSYERKF